MSASFVCLFIGRYLCDPVQLKQIAKRDQQQVYDLRVKDTLEKVSILSIFICMSLIFHSYPPSHPHFMA